MLKEGRILERHFHNLFLESSSLVTKQENKFVKKSKEQIIITLTTIPSRINRIYLVIESLLRQSLQADQIILWLDHDSFDWMKLPPELDSQLSRSLTVRYCRDYGSHKKLIPTLKSYPQSILVTCDDDAFYPSNRLETLYANYMESPETIQCTRWHVMTFNEKSQLNDYMNREFNTKKKLKPSLKVFPTWVWWVLYFPLCFDKEVFNEDVFMKFSYNADDIRFKLMSLMNNVPCQISEKILTDKWAPFANIYEVPRTQQENLVSSNIYEWRNDKVIRALTEHYKLTPLFKQLANQ